MSVNTLKNSVIIAITQNLNNEGIEILPRETAKYLPAQWYEMSVNDAELYVYYNYQLAEAQKDI
jgi:hypothetical protein